MLRDYKKLNARNPGVYWRKVEVINEHGHRSFVFQKMREQPPVEHDDPQVAAYLEYQTPQPAISTTRPYDTSLTTYIWDADYLIEADGEILGLLHEQD